jgi:uncharacterized protein (DUF362 family)
MPPSKKTTGAPKAAKAPTKKKAGTVKDASADVVAQDAVQPATITTNATAEQQNSAALSEEAVRQRAYELYQQRRGQGNRGDHHEDWFRAEREIRERSIRNA